MPEQYIPEFHGYLRKVMLRVPECITKASGIRIFGKKIRSLIFSTDVSVIRNTNANAVIAVYPFSPQPVITQALVSVADIPIFVGVGGGLTKGARLINLAHHAEYQGAIGVVVNTPTSNETIEELASSIDIPIVVTIVSENENYAARLKAGATILNVSAASRTPFVVDKIRRDFPEAAIIATGGPNQKTIESTISAGANAITWTPPPLSEILGNLMDAYRRGEGYPDF